jgi:hypothetical protein
VADDAPLRSALRAAAPEPRAPVDPHAVVARGRRLARRRTALQAAAVLLLVVPAVAAAVALTRPSVDLAEGGGPVPASLDATSEPPGSLVGGVAPPEVPAVVRARFDQPVVGTQRLTSLPPELADCDRAVPPTDAEAARGRWQRLLDAAGPVDGHRGPRAVTSLRTGAASAPPGYPDAYAGVCIGQRTAAGDWTAPGAGLTHLYDRWTGIASPLLAQGDSITEVAWATALAVPEGAAWAVQEHPGWWLAYEVDGASWLLVQSWEDTFDVLDTTVLDPGLAHASAAFPGARVVFLDGDAAVLADERVGTDAIRDDAPFLASQAVGARIRFDEAALRADLADGPVPACAEEVTVCVWMVDADGELLALSAASPLPADVPPLGAVGWCPGEGVFAGVTARTRWFAADGSWQVGSAPSSMHRYEVEVGDGEVVVDLSRFSFGAEHPADAEPKGPPPPSCTDIVEPGFDLP